jgi:Zn-dependent peptidase ImmA (M78 family)
VGIELARHRAHDLLQRTALANIQPLPIEALVEYLGVELIVTRLDGANAQLIEGAQSTSILISDRLTDAADRRWAIAHELGRLLLDHPSPPAAELCRPRPHPQTAKQRDGEAESDAFASALLIHPEVISEVRDLSPMTLGAPACSPSGAASQ